MKIEKVIGREILDSRGLPTLKVKTVLENGLTGEAAVPSGASTGKHEAREFRDGGKRYGGKGVLKAVSNVNGLLAEKLKGLPVEEQEKIDKLMIALDGTKNKKKLGANAILGVSLACARVAALVSKLPLYQYIRQSYGLRLAACGSPFPMMNVLNGGRHAENGLEIQEFMIVPRHKKMSEMVRAGSEIYQALKHLLEKGGYAAGVGDEGGFAPRLKNNEEGLKYLVGAIKKAGYVPGQEAGLALDCAASEFYSCGRYVFEGKKRTAKEMAEIYSGWLKKYPIISLEDPFAEDDWISWRNFNLQLKTRNLETLLVGDDLFVTNAERLKRGIEEKTANAILIKPNQIGTLTETMAAIQLARKNNYQVIISHRSGETADTFIADLATAVSAGYIKAGAPARSERAEKYNRLMEIEQENY